MNLFSKIYSSLLVGIIGLLILVGNLHYETEIRQFDANMAENAQRVGRIMAEVVARVLRENGAEMAGKLIEDANNNEPYAIQWIRLDEVRQKYGEKHPEIKNFDGTDRTRTVSFIGFDADHHTRLRYTFVTVPLPEEQPRGLQLTQPLTPLVDFSQKVLIRTLFVSLILALISCSVCYFLIFTKIRRPLDKLSRKAMEIGKGNLTADLEIQGDDELVHLAEIMNDMCTRLLIAQQKIHFENLARLKTLEQLRHTEKLSTVGQIAAGIAHEIGTPLNVVDGRAKMIISEPLQDEEIISCAKIIKAQAERMTLIIRRLLDFSRKKKAISKTNENVAVLIRQVFHLLSPLAAKQDVTLITKTAPETKVFCHVDGQQMQQVFMNIIMNGIQATPGRGRVEVELTNRTVKSMIRTDDQVQEFLRIDIRDEGEGIPEKNLGEIFTPFFTTKSVGLGTGLGLSIARELIEEHGGWIEVRNRMGRGAEFSIFLKLEEAVS